MAQAKVLQLRVTELMGQTTPPWVSSVTMERVLVLRPVPQVLVQAEYLDHMDILQSM